MPISREQLGVPQVEVPPVVGVDSAEVEQSPSSNHVDENLKSFFKKGEPVLTAEERAATAAAAAEDRAELKVDQEELSEKVDGDVQAPSDVEIVASPGQAEFHQAEADREEAEKVELDAAENPTLQETSSPTPESELPAWNTLTEPVETDSFDEELESTVETVDLLERARQRRSNLQKNLTIKRIDEKLLEQKGRLSRLEEAA